MKREQEIIHANESSSSKDFLFGAFLGGIVGAATALFLAPKPGKELLQDLNGQAGVLKEKGSEFISIAKDKTDQLSNVVTKTSVDIMDKVKNTKGQENTSDRFDELKEQASDLSTSLKSTEFDEIQQKLEETKRAFDETESKYNQ
ncbi:YtxH domain-containing protein [Niallia alba]|uniref:YtxH domain-containing protein n=1 Tax=Niallia alba TaxID=2729105 RepID=A0A7Y0KAE3_9BACI|nr:YtxH domain-containing protein [Niallia alba]NMO78839.1 YtxH domain-containing protein [Niallia alba]